MNAGGAPGAIWRRLWRRALRRWPRAVRCVYSEDYRIDIPGVTYDPLKGERVLGFLLAAGLVRPREVVVPPPATLRALTRVHDPAYLAALDEPGALAGAFGMAIPESLQARILAVQRAVVGGTIAAAEAAVATRGLGVNLGGGLHHALPAQARGFCVFNDVAVAIRRLRARRFDAPILVVDLDLHDGDGTRAVFASDPTVFTFSIHNRHWSVAPAVAALSVELPGEVEDGAYLEAVERHLGATLEAFTPALVVYLAGSDPAFDDRLGNWRITPTGMLARDRLVTRLVEERHGRLPWVVLLAGGYGGESWRYPARFLAGLLSGWRPIEPPSTEEATLARYRAVLRALTAHPVPREAPADLFSLSDEDLLPGGLAGTPPRWLGALAPLAVELLFEQTGLIERIRGMGFPDLRFELDLDNPAGQTVRLKPDEQAREPLLELRLSRDRRTVPGMELLAIEWLLLQNPRAEFAARQQPLPGQRHPGLGLLNDVMALLVSLAEHLGLDGVSFVASQYHLAAKARRFLAFLRPEDAWWFADLERRLADLPLGEASRALAQGRLRDDDGRPIAWRPLAMVLPVSARLRALLAGRDEGAATPV